MAELVLRFSGKLLLDGATSELARHQSSLRAGLASLNGPEKTKVVADLSELIDVDTSALAVILQLDRDVRRATGEPLVLRGARINLMSLAKLSSLHPVLCWEESAIH